MAADEVAFKADQAKEIVNILETDVAAPIRKVFAGMDAALEAHWGCWGNDKTGHQFADGPKGFCAGVKQLQEAGESAHKYVDGDKGYIPTYQHATKILNATEHANEESLKLVGKLHGYEKAYEDAAKKFQAAPAGSERAVELAAKLKEYEKSYESTATELKAVQAAAGRIGK